MKIYKITFWFQYEDNSFSFNYGIEEDRKLPLSLSLSEETVGSIKLWKIIIV